MNRNVKSRIGKNTASELKKNKNKNRDPYLLWGNVWAESGLRINLGKSEIVPIGEVLNIDEEYSWMSSNNSSYEILGTSIWSSF